MITPRGIAGPVRVALDFYTSWHATPVTIPFKVLVAGPLRPGIDTRWVEERETLHLARDNAAEVAGKLFDGAAPPPANTREGRHWQRLQQLAAAVPADANLRIELLNLSAEDALMDLEDVSAPAKSGMHRHIVGASYGSWATRPYSLLLGLWDLDDDDAGRAMADHCAFIGAASHTPWLLSSRADLAAQPAAPRPADQARYLAHTVSAASPAYWTLAKELLLSAANHGHAGHLHGPRLASALRPHPGSPHPGSSPSPQPGPSSAAEQADRLALTLLACEFARGAKIMVVANRGNWKAAAEVERNVQLWLNRWVGPASSGRPLAAAEVTVQAGETSFCHLPYQLRLSFHGKAVRPITTAFDGFYETP